MEFSGIKNYKEEKINANSEFLKVSFDIPLYKSNKENLICEIHIDIPKCKYDEFENLICYEKNFKGGD